MKSALLVIAGIIIGYLSATMAISQRAISSVEPGNDAWHELFNGEGDTIDPYVRAGYASLGRLLLAQGEDQLLETEVDSAGSKLDGGCSYLVSGPLPAVRWWQIAAVGGGAPADSDPRARPDGISSAQMIGEADGHFKLTIARDAAPGNWIAPGTNGRFRLLFTLHRDVRPVAGDMQLPKIERVACA